ncbi:MAG: hypothetical protein ACRD2E_15205 [Terriglobales bacterium]
MRPRPIGISLLAVLNFAVAAVMAGVGAAMLVHGSGVLRSPVAQRVLQHEGAGGVWFLVLSTVLLAVLMGVGLLRVRDWGRQLMMIYCGIGLASSALMLLAEMLRFAVEPALLWLASAVIAGMILRYLTRPEIKRAFAVPARSKAQGA